MKITAEEQLMYGVMRAIYDGGIPVDFKGAMVLKICLLEAGYKEEIRHTVDIDGNWYSDSFPTADQMTNSLQKAFEKAGIELDIRMYRMYGDGRSAGFEILNRDNGEMLFTMDIDVNRPIASTRIYEFADFRFRGVSVDHMLADKILVVSEDKVFRRIKDVVDLYYLSQSFSFRSTEVLKIISGNGKDLGSFQGFLHGKDELKHAYDKFRLAGEVSKPSFIDVYESVKEYIRDIIPQE